MFSSPFFASILGKRKEESESEASSGEESQDETEKMEEENVESDEESDDEDENVPTEDNIDTPGASFDPSTATLSQLLTKIIPDAKIHCPNVIIVGAQSSGKTKMIISMVFHHLIENPSVTDEMGEKLLKIFRTGEKMVTRRPTKIEFVKTESGSPCNISVSLEGVSAEFADPKFSEIIDSVHMESLNRDGKAFGKELVVTIAAPDLPSMTFTDLPGLITDDRAVSDEEGMSIRKLVKKYMRKVSTTLVVVEPASTEDFETSQVAPLLKELRDSDRPHIFNNAVLVLSKCDKIRQGLEGRIMAMMDLTSPTIADYPFKHVVGVVNKVESVARTPTAAGDSQSFAEFKQTFRATKQHEKEIFSSYKNLDESACNHKTQCTTAAVFHQMDRITFDTVHHSIGRGLEMIEDKVAKLEQQMRDELAPPLSFYDTLLQGPDGRSVVDKSGRLAMLRTLREALKVLFADAFSKLKIYERHPYDQAKITTAQAAFLEKLGIKWPEGYTPGDMYISQGQTVALEGVRKFFNRFVSKKIHHAALDVLDDSNTGCFSGIHSRFHRIDRFGLLVDALGSLLRDVLPGVEQSAKESILGYLEHFSDFIVPRGVNKERFGRLLDELHNVTVRKVFEALRAAIRGENLDGLFLQDVLFVETPDFVALRNELHGRWEKLRQQKWILARCKQVSSNEQLRDTLQEAYEEQLQRQLTKDRDGRDEQHWLEFWRQAEVLEQRAAVSRKGAPRAPPTSMFARASSTSSEVPVVSSTQASQQDFEPMSQIEVWPQHEQQHESQGSGRQASQASPRVSAAMDVSSPSARHSQSQSQSQPQSLSRSHSQQRGANSQSQGQSSQRDGRRVVREEEEHEVMPALVAESVAVVEPEAPTRQHSHESSTNVTAFKRFKASHDQQIAPATTTNAPLNTHWASYDAPASPVPASSTTSFSTSSNSGAHVGSPTFVFGQVAGSPPPRAQQNSFLHSAGSAGRTGSLNGTSGAAVGGAGGVLSTVKNFMSNWSSPTAEPLAAPKSTILYRPNYNANTAHAPTTHVPMTSPSGGHNAPHASTTPSNGTSYANVVKREVEYTSFRAEGSREAKGSPEDMIDLTD